MDPIPADLERKVRAAIRGTLIRGLPGSHLRLDPAVGPVAGAADAVPTKVPPAGYQDRSADRTSRTRRVVVRPGRNGGLLRSA